MTTDTATAASSASRLIRDAENARARALVDADTDALRELVDDELIVTHSNGRRDTAAELLAHVATGTLRYLAFDTEIAHITVRQDHAVVTGTLTAQIALPNGDTHPLQALSTTVWSRAEERWLLLAAHTTSATSR